jgi:hypothetical protein
LPGVKLKQIAFDGRCAQSRKLTSLLRFPMQRDRFVTSPGELLNHSPPYFASGANDENFAHDRVSI